MSGSLFPLGSTVVTCMATDAAGNRATGTFTVRVKDTAAPVLVGPAGVAATATSAGGAVVTFPSPSAFDLVSGPVGVRCSPPSGAQFPLGVSTVPCTATDASGNARTVTFPLKVCYSWSGVLQPVNADVRRVFRPGRTVPVKFQRTGASAGIPDAVAGLYLRNVSGGIAGTELEADSTAAATEGKPVPLRPRRYQYHFNLGTKGLAPGTWQPRIDLGDGELRTVVISLR